MALKCETNTATMNRRITKVAKIRFPGKALDVYFEHGQWWVILSTGAIYSVVDGEGGPSIDGFDFEQVSEGEEA